MKRMCHASSSRSDAPGLAVDFNPDEYTHFSGAFRAEGPSQYQPSPDAGAARAEPASGLGIGARHMWMRAVGPHRLPGPMCVGDLRGPTARDPLNELHSQPANGPSVRLRTGLVSARTFGPNTADRHFPLVYTRQDFNPRLHVGLSLRDTNTFESAIRFGLVNRPFKLRTGSQKGMSKIQYRAENTGLPVSPW